MKSRRELLTEFGYRGYTCKWCGEHFRLAATRRNHETQCYKKGWSDEGQENTAT